MSANLNTTLVFPEAYNDNCFLDKIWSRQYTKVILLDETLASQTETDWQEEDFFNYLR
jgi:hypothetical protein